MKNLYRGKCNGIMELQWDNTDSENRVVAQGVYFVQIINLDADESMCKKVIKVR